MRIPIMTSAPAPAGHSPAAWRGWRLPTWLLASLLGSLTLALYWQVTRNDFINYDDDYYVTANVHVLSGLTWENIRWAFSHQVVANWHPLTMVSHMLDCQLYGLQSWGHHLTNLLLHALNTVLVFLALRRLTGATGRSAWVAVLFACHPAHVESVAWVAERKDLLSALFGFLALLFYAQYAAPRDSADRAPGAVAGAFHRSPHYWLAWGSFALGLMCKPMLVTWPFLLLVLDYWPLARFRSGNVRALLVEKLPFLALTIAACVVTYLVQNQVGAVAPLRGLTLAMRGGNALISYCRYLGELCWPQGLAVYYPHPGYWPLSWVLLAGGTLIGLTALVWRARRRSPFLLAGWLWFVGTLVPVIGLVQVGNQAMADRYTYIPSVGLLVLIIWGAGELARSWRLHPLTLAVVGAAAMGVLSAATWLQIGYWQNSETLFRHALSVTKNNEISHSNLGATLLVQGQTKAAISEFQEAVRLNPQADLIHFALGIALGKGGETNAAISQLQQALRLNPKNAEVHNNLGRLLAGQGQTAAATSEFETALRLKPDYAEACLCWGSLLSKTGQTNAAISQFQAAIRLNPDYAAAHFALAGQLQQTGQIADAIREYEAGIKATTRIKAPQDAEAHNNLANLLAVNHQPDAAIRAFHEALHLRPNYADAHFNLGNTLSKLGVTDGAILEYQAVVRLKPDDTETHYKLGNLLAAKGQTDAAIGEFQEAIRLKPDFIEAHGNLGSLLAKQGQADAAIGQFQAALRLKPDYAEASYNLGNIFLKTGQLEQAVSQYQAALRQLPDFPPAHYYLGVALSKQGQAEAAIRQFQEALRLKPDFTAASKSLARALELKNAPTNPVPADGKQGR